MLDPRSFMWVCWSVALIGCPGGEPKGDPTTADPTPTTTDPTTSTPAVQCAAGATAVTPGTGRELVVALADGDPVIMVHGPQGGWHIELAGLVAETGELVSVEAVFTDPATGLPVAGVEQVANRIALVDWDPSTCAGDFYGVLVFLDDVDQSVVCDLAGVTLQLDVTVTGLEANPPIVATASVAVRAELDPLDVDLCAAL